jgi:hypothetical protein
MYAVARYYRTCKIRKRAKENDWCTLWWGKLRLILENISEGIIVANADKKLF